MDKKERTARLREVWRLDARDMVASTVFAAKRYLAERPTASAMMLACADSLSPMARYDEARALLRRLLRVCPQKYLHSLYWRFGDIYELKGCHRLAERWYRRGVQQAPRNATLRRLLGDLLAKAGRLHEAEPILRRATRCKRGGVADAFLSHGLVLRSLERYVEARRCFHRVVAIDPKCQLAQAALADLDHMLRCDAVAKAADKRAVRERVRASAVSAPSPAMLKRQRRARLRELKRLDDRGMIVSLLHGTRRYLVERPKARGVWSGYARTLYELRRFEEARAAITRAGGFRLPERRPWTFAFLGQIYSAKGSFRIAERWYRRAMNVQPQQADWRYRLGGLAAKAGRLEEAVALHRTATKCKTGCIDEALLNLGLCLRALDRFAEARTCFRRAIALDPKSKEAKDALADVDYVIAQTNSSSSRSSRTSRRRPR